MHIWIKEKKRIFLYFCGVCSGPVHTRQSFYYLGKSPALLINFKFTPPDTHTPRHMISQTPKKQRKRENHDIFYLGPKLLDRLCSDTRIGHEWRRIGRMESWGN
jgi:hypothetical protein